MAMGEQERRNRYRGGYQTNGAAAYDMRTYRGTAAPEIERPQLPEEQRQPVRRIRVRARTAVSPFAVFGTIASICMLVLVIFGYVQLYEATSQVGELSDRLAALNSENQVLQSQYEGKIDLAAIEDRAVHELGMSQPTASQTVYINLSGSDRAVIVEPEHENRVVSLLGALRSSVESLVSYLSQ